VESALAEFVQMPRSLLFSSGYQANIGAVTALAGPGDAVFSDELNHASLIDGVRLSRAQVVRYPHGDVDFLSQALASCESKTKLIVTDGVFSMDGDLAPVPALLDGAGATLAGSRRRARLRGARRGGAVAGALRRALPRIVYVGTPARRRGVGRFRMARSRRDRAATGTDLHLHWLRPRCSPQVEATVADPRRGMAAYTRKRYARSRVVGDRDRSP
jgi:hypothetical protein